MLKITPNRLTLLRIFLLPLPCVLLFGGPEWKLTAVGLGSLLGLTDYLDGRLARRYGSSNLGRVLDPVADKIFVSVVYLLLTKLSYVPFWASASIVLREVVVTALRASGLKDLKVWKLTKFKTTVQMTSAGAVVVLRFFPYQLEGFVFLLLLGVVSVTWLSAVPYFWRSLKELVGAPERLVAFSLRCAVPFFLVLKLYPNEGLWPLALVFLSLYFLAEFWFILRTG